MTIQVTYTAKWQIINAPWYKWTTCKKLINTRSGREVKKTMKGSKAGDYIDRKFVPLSDLKARVEIIKSQLLPF